MSVGNTQFYFCRFGLGRRPHSSSRRGPLITSSTTHSHLDPRIGAASAQRMLPRAAAALTAAALRAAPTLADAAAAPAAARVASGATASVAWRPVFAAAGPARGWAAQAAAADDDDGAGHADDVPPGSR